MVALLSLAHERACEVELASSPFHPRVVRGTRGKFLPQMGWTAPSCIDVPNAGEPRFELR
jgi:hypothetical protein